MLGDILAMLKTLFKTTSARSHMIIPRRGGGNGSFGNRVADHEAEEGPVPGRKMKRVIIE